ncbi:DNA polymerase III subunit delta' [Spiroplasma helicoides]|uniref:DNA polymerase III subunit delta n=1 Tax=Spiroplasma helicoides TaxID=216938 RepID=A0A1B3SJ58_9MOLU|nr:hypothetical protein [Spiroplasma helicoides]AOG59965.1 DNA polymerase III subunit delta' [Spiroplasma helicoides]
MTKKDIILNINNLILEKKLFHSIIFLCPDQSELNNLTNEVVRMIFCEQNSLENDDCIWCQRVVNNSTFNFLDIGDGMNPIKKEKINELINSFSLSSIEDKDIKLYRIANLENLSESASNSLLKFLEEPPKKVIAILQSNDRNQILQTILSRCKVFNLERPKENYDVDKTFYDLLISNKADDVLLYSDKFKKFSKKEQIDILKYVYNFFVLESKPNLAEDFLDSIFVLKNETYVSLVIENLFIKIYEVLNESYQ